MLTHGQGILGHMTNICASKMCARIYSAVPYIILQRVGRYDKQKFVETENRGCEKRVSTSPAAYDKKCFLIGASFYTILQLKSEDFNCSRCGSAHRRVSCEMQRAFGAIKSRILLLFNAFQYYSLFSARRRRFCSRSMRSDAMRRRRCV